MAPAPDTAPPVGAEDEGASRDQEDNSVVLKSEDVSMGGVEDEGGLPAPSSEPAGAPEVAPERVEDKGGDTTECSSSFGDTFSGFDDEADGGEPEVNSQQVPGPDDGDMASMLPRRKKVTAEWRNSIRPVMWRCQWLELRMKDLSSQVSRYDRELALIEKEKELQQAVSETNGSIPDAMPIGKGHRNSRMERRKRNGYEDSEDTSIYIKKHPIMSYYNDKQSKGAETDGLVVDDDSNNQVDGGITGGLDTVALLDAEEYDTILEQVSLKDILSTIDEVQSQIHLLKDRLNKAHIEEDNLAFSEDSTHIRVPRKRQSTQKFCDNTYMKYANTKPQIKRNARPQKKKNLNILLKDDNGPVAVKPGFPDSGTYYQIQDTKANSAGRSGERNRSQDRSISMDLLLGVDNCLANGHMGDLCKENADDILIDNRSANEGCPQFEKLEHLPSETSSKGQNTSGPVEVEKKSAPVKVDDISSPLTIDDTSATVINQEALLEKTPMLKPVKKREWKPKERNLGWGSASSSMNHCVGTSTTSDAEQKSKVAPPSAKVKTESSPTAPEDPEIMTPLSAWKKRKAGNKSAAEEEQASKKQKTGMSAGNKPSGPDEHKAGSVASKNQKTEKSSTGTKKRKTENSPSAAKKQETENSSPAAKTQETKSTQSASKLMVEKAVLVSVNSRRSQRVRKPKVY